MADLATRFDVLSRGTIAATAKREEIEPNGLLSFIERRLRIKEKEESANLRQFSRIFFKIFIRDNRVD